MKKTAVGKDKIEAKKNPEKIPGFTILSSLLRSTFCSSFFLCFLQGSINGFA